MSSNVFHRYIWLADTIYRAGRITFAEINRRWLHNNMSEAVEEFFDIRRLLQADQRILYRK